MASSTTLPLRTPVEAESLSAKVEKREDDSIALSGPLTAATVPEVWEAGQQLLSSATDVLIDLAGVSRCDSAGAAMVVDWVVSRRCSGGTVAVRDLPEQMRAILEVSDLDELVVGDPAP